MSIALHKPLPEFDLRFIREHVPADKLRSMYGVVTGATGWFGAWICSALDYMGCKYSKIDTRDLHPFQCDYCIHLAPRDSAGLIGLLEKSDVKHVLFTSSGSVYDAVPSENCIEKRAQENLFLKSDLPVNIARCFSFIGAGICQKDLAPGKFIKACATNRPLIINSPDSIRTYMYMSDLVVWLLNILLFDKGKIYDVGGDEKITIYDLAVKISIPFGVNTVILEDGEYATDHRPNYVPNIQRAQEELGLRVYTDLDTAIDKTIEWERL